VTYQNRDAEWTFFSFLGIMLIPIIGYLLCYLVVPDLGAEKVDLQETYHDNRAGFFGLIILAVAVSFGRDVLAGGIPLDVNSAFRVGFLLTALGAIVVKREAFHVAKSVLGLLLLCAYVAAEFLRLE
jgi:sugar phosphate permease